jgi:hypothetical protein
MRTRGLIGRGVTVGGIGVLSLTVAGMGIATASNGGSLVLGHANSATKTTTLKDAKGTPLTLVGKKSKPPLTVNSSKQVAHLNASLLGGQSATGLATSGSAATLGPTSDVPLGDGNTNGTLLAATKKLSPGTYFVTASAETVDTNATTTAGIRCFVGETSDFSTSFAGSGSDSYGTQSASETTVVKLTTSAVLGEYCYSENGDTTNAASAGIFAIKIAHATIGTTAE